MDDDVKAAELVEATPGVLNYSFSTLRNQGECSARIYFRDLAKQGLIKEDYALPLVFGSGVHKAIEECVANGTDLKETLHEYIHDELWDKFKIAEHDLPKVQERMAHSEVCLDNFEQLHLKQILDAVNNDGGLLEVKLQASFRKGVMRGVVDVLVPGKPWIDWKSGMKTPGERMLMRDPQSVIYYDLARRIGMEPPKKFDYVYLVGKNVNMVEKEYKSGKRKGEKYMAADADNPRLLTRFSVQNDDDKVRRIFNEWVNPLAFAYENKVYEKKVSDMNCAACLYRTACKTTELPERTYE